MHEISKEQRLRKEKNQKLQPEPLFETGVGREKKELTEDVGRKLKQTYITQPRQERHINGDGH